MRRGDVIEVPKANRPPDAMAVPKRPNVWEFHTGYPPAEVGGRLAKLVDPLDDRNGEWPIIGEIAEASAVLLRRPASRKSVRLPLHLEWAAEAEGSRVTCRMKLPFELVLFAGVWMVATLSPLTSLPGLLVDVFHGRGLYNLIGLLLFAALGAAAPWFLRRLLDRDRQFLMRYVTEMLEVRTVRERRE